MAVVVGGSAVVLPMPPRTVSRSVRKIGLVGSHSASLGACPWADPSWELWGHASARAWYKRELDRYFDLHPKACWYRGNRKGLTYPDWLKRNTVPIYMQERFADVPAAVRYPKERILLEFGGARRYFKNHAAWMIALAFAEGATHIGLFGINYGHVSEYEMQRGSAEYWLGRAEERGIHLMLPDECTLLSEPKGLYGYESHDDEGRLVDTYRQRIPKPAETIVPLGMGGEKFPLVKPPAHLKDQIAFDELDRPSWAAIPIDRSDGHEHAQES